MVNNVALVTGFFNLSTRFYLLLYVCKVSLDLGNKTNDLILNLTPENVTQHSRIE